ncbi:hypothetical protein MNBD_GAMMA06-2219 [hydrothermal vent metagenome]|uniref:Uncharacterized protein n=1 Tax=hydrothermal vent metagenome TaxID=652676 RepID=A0A3B0WTS8_9ZZZZ
MAATAIFSAAFYALAFPMLLPIAVRAAMEGDGLHNIFSIITIIYLFSLIFFHRNIHNTLIRSLTLQLENMDMAKALEKKTTK